MTGRSKSGLQISVPGRKALESVSTVDSGPFSGKSIIYTYISSSSSSGRTTASFGAVGDHLASAKGLSSNERLPVLHEDLSVRSTENPLNAESNGCSLLAKLRADSIPDEDQYKLLVIGETGPCGQGIEPFLVSQSAFSFLPRRRRSLSDLVDNPRGGLRSSQSNVVSSSSVLQSNKALVTAHPEVNHSWLGSPAHSTDFEDSTAISEPLIVPVWQRRGPPFKVVSRQATGRSMQIVSSDNKLDPPTFQLPFGVSACYQCVWILAFQS